MAATTGAMNWYQRLIVGLAAFAKVKLVQVGKEGDGVSAPFSPAGTTLDKDWHELLADQTDAREAWRTNPLAKRLIGLTTSYVVGPGIALSSEYGPLEKFIRAFWYHPSNLMDLRLDEWSDELARAGELFPVLFTGPDGMSEVRTVPASQIEQIQWRNGDYETELAYRETTGPGEPEKWWISPANIAAYDSDADGLRPWMLHFAVNRPIGAIRGESDLAPILTWLRRYTGWLEDRVRLNAAVRAFVWIVYAPQRLMSDLRQRYARPPQPGSVIIAEEGAEKWEAVTPNLNARDAKEDGKAVRWMITAGGPGTTLGDLGEAEGEGMKAGKDTDELRRRFLLRRQRYFGHILSVLTVTAYNRWLEVGNRRHRPATVQDITVHAPDISSVDNEKLAGAAVDLVQSLQGLGQMVGDSEALRRYAVRLYTRYVGEDVSDSEFDELLKGVKEHDRAVQDPANQGSGNGGQSSAGYPWRLPGANGRSVGP